MEDNKVTGGKPKSYTINYGQNLFASQGWQCPICLRVMSPYISYCPFCPQQSKTVGQDDIYKINVFQSNLNNGIDKIECTI